MHLRRAGILAGAVALLCATPAGAKTCDEPAADWSRAAPADAGMDAAKLQEALDYGTSELGFAVRVYRRGCLVGEDRAAAVNRGTQFESWSMAKSVTSLVFGRAMTLGLISPDDPVGALVTEADRAHGAITARDLLTMTSGLRWNGFRDYDIAMPDRLKDALTVGIAHPPGEYYEYSQSGPALLAEAVQRAVGEDFQAFAQRELLTPLGIEPGTWRWVRDSKGHTQGFFGVQMTPDDYGRLGELLRRGGVWKGRRLLSTRYVREAVAPSPTNGCYGWLIWVNAAKPCIGPRITERPVTDSRDFPDLPADLYRFSGLFGQLVTVFPSQDLVVVRTGQDKGLVFAGGAGWEHDLYAKVLASITDQRIEPPGDAPAVGGVVDRPNADKGFQDALLEPQEYAKPWLDEPLPPAGPERARAVRLRLAHPKVSRKRIVTARLTCPARAPRACRGTATLERAKGAKRYAAAPGRTILVRFRLRHRPKAPVSLVLGAVNEDATGGTPSRISVTIRR
ncbi:MAG: serine hydrolase [Solirubrobacterales bacterium]|nr:serine hydrolase [Solirubrobacterales bacterium]